MAKSSPFLAATLAVLISISMATQADTIHLVDGSSINGEVVTLKKGVYTIRSTSMGIIKLHKAQVKSISGGSSDFIDNQYAPNYYNNINQNIATNSALQQSIYNLNSDPIVQQILADPELMGAIQRQDIQTLQNNPLIQQLMNQPKMKAITSQLQ